VEAHWTEVDGVPTLCAAAGEVQGALHAMLTFATGRGDETVLDSGINHVVEHLVLHDIGGAASHISNGRVDLVSTAFWIHGSPDEVVTFLAAIARGLGELPLERFDDELRVLGIEALRYNVDSNIAQDLVRRFGPHGAGLVGYQEFGLKAITAERAQQWANTRFVAENAVLWCSGPLPAGVHLDELPRGARPERAPLPRLRPDGRCYADIESPHVSFSILYEGNSDADLAVSFAQERTHEQLRHEAVSYGVQFDRFLVGSDHGLAFLLADTAKGEHAHVARALVDAVEDLAEHGPRAEELAKRREYHERFAADPQYRLARLERIAHERLLEGRELLPADADERAASRTVASVRDDLCAVLDTTFVTGPEGVAEELGDWGTVPYWTNDWLRGTDFHTIPGRGRGVMTVGDDGIMFTLEPDKWRTTRWAAVEALLAVENGAREIIDTAGGSLVVLPWQWQSGEEIVRRIDDGVDRARAIRLGPGESHYGDGENDTLTHVRWLTTIAHARINRKRHDLVSLVIDTDGIFLVHGPAEDQAAHFQDLRAADRETLLAGDSRNRWLADGNIDVVELMQRSWSPVGLNTWMLTIWTADGERHRVFLPHDDQVSAAHTHLPRLLGARYVVH
jgi:zinc protease